MNKNTHTKPNEAEKPLNRTQATWVATWLSRINKDVINGWMGVYDMLPSTVAEKFGVSVTDVNAALRGEKR